MTEEEKERLEEEVRDYLDALKSIAGSSCCGDCQEAKRVAQSVIETHAPKPVDKVREAFDEWITKERIMFGEKEKVFNTFREIFGPLIQEPQAPMDEGEQWVAWCSFCTKYFPTLNGHRYKEMFNYCESLGLIGGASGIEQHDIEYLAEKVHEAYLVTCKKLGWDVKEENQVPYSDLIESSKELDRASVQAVLDNINLIGGASGIEQGERIKAWDNRIEVEQAKRLREYSKHKDDCDTVDFNMSGRIEIDGQCTCGLDKLLTPPTNPEE